MNACDVKGNPTLEQRIAGCTAMIGSGQWSGDGLALVLNNRGSAYNDKKDYKRAIADLTEAIRLDPKLAIAYYNRGNSYFDLTDFPQAIRNYDQAIKLNPSYAKAISSRGAAYLNTGNRKRGVADLKKAHALGDPMAREGLRQLGLVP
jgi:tetratricopeptide (TPR) repeat protein